MTSYNYTPDKCIYRTLADAVLSAKEQAKGLFFSLKSVIIQDEKANTSHHDVYWMALREVDQTQKLATYEFQQAFENSPNLTNGMHLNIDEIPINTYFYRNFFPYKLVEDEDYGARIVCLKRVLKQSTAIKLAICQGLDIEGKKVEAEVIRLCYKANQTEALLHAWHIFTPEDYRLIPLFSKYTKFIEDQENDDLIGGILPNEATFIEEDIGFRLRQFARELYLEKI